MGISSINNVFLGVRRLPNYTLLTLAFVAVLSWSFMALTRSASAACGSGNLCLYIDAAYNGLYTEYYSPSVGCHNLSSTFNNQVSSILNYTSHSITFYQTSNCNVWFSYSFTIGAGGYNYNLANIGQNDAISSFYVN